MPAEVAAFGSDKGKVDTRDISTVRQYYLATFPWVSDEGVVQTNRHANLMTADLQQVGLRCIFAMGFLVPKCVP